MNQFGTAISNDFGVSLTQAILVYGSSKNDGPAYATTHQVHTTPEGRAEILAGVPLSNEALGSLIDAFLRTSKLNHYLPANVLSVGFNNVVWWCKPDKRSMFFKCGDKRIGTRSGITPHPGLVFVAKEKSLSIFAVEDDQRPTPDTPLCHAPYMNVWIGGRVCTGTAVLPNHPVAELVTEWEKAFFGSFFTHPNSSNEKMISYEGGMYQLWADLLDGKHEEFPKVLLKTGKTLGQVLDTVSQDQ